MHYFLILVEGNPIFFSPIKRLKEMLIQKAEEVNIYEDMNLKATPKKQFEKC